MSHLVQDLLDFAQIKSGNFRKNIKSFNIRETVDNVMCIQRRKAEQQKIELKATFTNIREASTFVPATLENFRIHKTNERKLFSPIVYTDEQRVMQVLLNLQSNALKFTQTGSV
mmetsp:Transcript_26458/g.40393  ORF Transcript_26458/g.40393 Transcript_26458/m.40393 type:complete len:114 (-) Transcript_26458:793-1134(-)